MPTNPRMLQDRALSTTHVSYYYSANRQFQNVASVDSLDLDSFPAAKITCIWLEVMQNAMGEPVKIPIMIAKGTKPGPVLGLTAAIHGNEIQGMPCIHAIFRDIATKLDDLVGTVVAVSCVNPYGYQLQKRTYVDDVDLNRVMPGKVKGTISQQYAHYFMEKVVKKLGYLVDLHTASFGHVNSLYVRADLTHPITSKMAMLQGAQVLVHNCGEDGTLRSAAMKLGINAITVEMGNPHVFQNRFINITYDGILKVMDFLKMIKFDQAHDSHANDDVNDATPVPTEPVICSRSYWSYTEHGGILTVYPETGSFVKKGEVIASIVDVFGFIIAKYTCPEDGIVVGKTTNPSNHQGDRVLHLGIPTDISSLQPKTAALNIDDV